MHASSISKDNISSILIGSSCRVKMVYLQVTIVRLTYKLTIIIKAYFAHNRSSVGAAAKVSGDFALIIARHARVPRTATA